MSKSRVKEIDVEIARLKREKPDLWVRKLISLKREKDEINSKIGLNKKK